MPALACDRTGVTATHPHRTAIHPSTPARIVPMRLTEAITSLASIWRIVGRHA
jgi:hypothetical protein